MAHVHITIGFYYLVVGDSKYNTYEHVDDVIRISPGIHQA